MSGESGAQTTDGKKWATAQAQGRMAAGMPHPQVRTRLAELEGMALGHSLMAMQYKRALALPDPTCEPQAAPPDDPICPR